MGFQYDGELRYVAICSTGTIFEVPVDAGFREMYDAIKRELKASVGRSLFYEYAYCDVYEAYVVERWSDEYDIRQTQKCFEKKIGHAFASCIDRHTGFDYRREW